MAQSIPKPSPTLPNSAYLGVRSPSIFRWDRDGHLDLCKIKILYISYILSILEILHILNSSYPTSLKGDWDGNLSILSKEE
jgi:hypothetical protein